MMASIFRLIAAAMLIVGMSMAMKAHALPSYKGAPNTERVEINETGGCSQSRKYPMMACTYNEGEEIKTMWCVPKYFGVTVPGNGPISWLCTHDEAEFDRIMAEIKEAQKKLTPPPGKQEGFQVPPNHWKKKEFHI